MATGKRYYWIKLKDSFFTSDTVDFFMGQEGGANYIVLYQMLQLMTANTEGRLQRRIGEVIIPYDVAKIKRDCKWFSEDTIRVAMELYKQFGLIYEGTDGVLVMTDHQNLVGSETDYAQQKRLQRESIKELNTAQSCEKVQKENMDNVHGDVHSDVCKNVHTDIRDKIIDNRYISYTAPDEQKEVDKTQDKKEKKPIKPSKIIPPSVEQVRAYCIERKNGIDPEAFCDFYTARDWMSGKTKIKDWQAAVRTWEKKNGKKPPASPQAQERKEERFREYEERNRIAFESMIGEINGTTVR